MKYIKTFEEIKTIDDLHLIICNFLVKIDPSKFKVKRAFYEKGKTGRSLSFEIIKQGRNTDFWGEELSTVFTIRIHTVTDKKLINEKIKTKIKIVLDSIHMHNDKDTVPVVIDFLKNIFKKYSYFQQDIVNFNNNENGKYEYFINTLNINNIENDLNDFESIITANKYNL